MGSGIDSLPHALPALSQPGFQVSWNLIQSWLCRDGDVIPLAGLRAPGSPISAAEPALGGGTCDSRGQSPKLMGWVSHKADGLGDFSKTAQAKKLTWCPGARL